MEYRGFTIISGTFPEGKLYTARESNVSLFTYRFLNEDGTLGRGSWFKTLTQLDVALDKYWGRV